MRKSQARQGHAPRARKNGKARQKPGKLLNVSEDGRKFASNFDDLQRGTLHVPITSQCEKWSAKGLIGKEKARDTYNVTEDADLGYRLARDGYRVDVIGPPTYEEAPVTFNAWLNQRTRWIKGHLQTWLVLMRNPFRTAREMGFLAFASMQLVFATGLLAAFAHGPLAFILLTALLTPYDLLTPADLILAIAGYCVAIFASLTACALSNSISHARAALTMPLYWPLASIAAYRALFELIFRPHYWAKTKHGVSARTPQDVNCGAPTSHHTTARAA